MKKLILGICLLFSVNVYAGLINDGTAAYENGDFKKAIKLFTKSCDGGDPLGCANLGIMYRNGTEVRQDYKKAIKLYTKACDDGHSVACTHLGFMYEKGTGVKHDSKKAVNLYVKACNGGDANACRKIGH